MTRHKLCSTFLSNSVTLCVTGRSLLSEDQILWGMLPLSGKRERYVQIAYVDVRQPGGWEFTSKYTRLRGQRVLEPRFGTDWNARPRPAHDMYVEPHGACAWCHYNVGLDPVCFDHHRLTMANHHISEKEGRVRKRIGAVLMLLAAVYAVLDYTSVVEGTAWVGALIIGAGVSALTPLSAPPARSSPQWQQSSRCTRVLMISHAFFPAQVVTYRQGVVRL